MRLSSGNCPLNSLLKEKELLEEIPEEFLLKVDRQLQGIRRMLQLKKVNPDQMSILGASQLAMDGEDEQESLINERGFNGNGILKV
jgi:hypothetical protein